LALDPKRKGDIKVIVAATIGVLFVGFFIFGAMMMTTRGGSGPQCGQLSLGLATGVRNTLENGPYFQTGGGSCGFTLALSNGDIVAYKVVQPSGCTALWKFDHWECDGERIHASELAQYPVSIQTEHGADAVVVNLGTPAPSSTTTTVAPSATTAPPMPKCGHLNIGLARDIRSALENGPYFQTGGGNCSFTLALANGDIVAYKVAQPSGCAAHFKSGRWECDGREIDAARLAQYPVKIETASGVETVVVNLTKPTVG
jgi:hypothetical protein